MDDYIKHICIPFNIFYLCITLFAILDFFELQVNCYYEKNLLLHRWIRNHTIPETKQNRFSWSTSSEISMSRLRLRFSSLHFRSAPLNLFTSLFDLNELYFFQNRTVSNDKTFKCESKRVTERYCNQRTVIHDLWIPGTCRWNRKGLSSNWHFQLYT